MVRAINFEIYTVHANIQGRWSPGQGEGGGVLFFAWPKGKGKTLGDTVRLEYQVYFPQDFPWVKGGKLPGIIGGKTGCGGGDDADDCFSGMAPVFLIFATSLNYFDLDASLMQCV